MLWRGSQFIKSKKLKIKTSIYNILWYNSFLIHRYCSCSIYLFRYVLYFYHVFYLPLLILGFQFTIIIVIIFFNPHLMIFSHWLGRMRKRKGERQGGMGRRVGGGEQRMVKRGISAIISTLKILIKK